MNGIRIRGKLRFAQLFSTVLERLAGSIWIAESEAFLCPDEWYEGSTFDVALDRYVGGIIGEFERGALEITDPQQSENGSTLGHIGEIDHLARFANAVREDWNLIVVLPNRPADPGAWFRASWQAASRPVYFETHCIAVFCNIDAAYWEFYSNRESPAGASSPSRSHRRRLRTGSIERWLRYLSKGAASRWAPPPGSVSTAELRYVATRCTAARSRARPAGNPAAIGIP